MIQGLVSISVVFFENGSEKIVARVRKFYVTTRGHFDSERDQTIISYFMWKLTMSIIINSLLRKKVVFMKWQVIVVSELAQYGPRRFVTTSLYEKAVQGQKSFCRQFAINETFWAIFLHDSLQTLQCSRLKIHIKASFLKLAQFDVT